MIEGVFRGLGGRWLLLGLFVLFLVACQAGPDSATLTAKATLLMQEPAPTSTPRPTPPPTDRPPTVAPTNTARPTATPEPRLYTVQSGDSLLALALDLGVTVEVLLQANPGLDPDGLTIGQLIVIPAHEGGLVSPWLPTPVHLHTVQEAESWDSIAAKYSACGVTSDTLRQTNPAVSVLTAGQTIVLPLAEGRWHYISPGDDLLAIAIQYDLTLEQLVEANLGVLDPDNLDITQVGWLLCIPTLGEIVAYDCSPLPPRTAVIEYTVQNGEGLYCLSRKFGLSMTTILQANQDQIVGQGGLTGGVVLVIPPADGAVYTITAADVAAGTTLEDLMLWYSISDVENITEWDGNPVQEPLVEGRRLFLRGADPLAGQFQAPIIINRNCSSSGC
jgi:LysM repeat protein